MHERIKKARESINCSQSQLARDIHLNRSTVSLYESGAREPSDRTIADICRVCGVREEWLRTGEGPMKPEKPPDDHYDVDSALKEIASERELTPFEMNFVRAFLSLTPEQRNVFEQMFGQAVEETSAAEKKRKELHEELDREMDEEKNTPEKSSDSSVG